jgi:hypothetical protein
MERHYHNPPVVPGVTVPHPGVTVRPSREN